MEYRHILNFKYNNKPYGMFLDNKNRRYFMKIVDNKFVYPTMDELVMLSYTFIKDNRIKEFRFGNKKFNFIPKVNIRGFIVPLVLSSSLLLSACGNSYKKLNETEQNDNEYTATSSEEDNTEDMVLKDTEDTSEYSSSSSSNDVSEDDVLTYISSEDLDVSDELVVDTHLVSDWAKFDYIYDMDYLSDVLDYDNVSLNDLNIRIDSNRKIPDKYKELIKEYCQMVYDKYPDTDFRVLYENLKTLKVEVCDESELTFHTYNPDSYGCYIVDDNAIYLSDKYTYEKGSWEYQVLLHELGHCLRNAKWEKDGSDVRITCQGQNYENYILEEALDSVFTVSLFDYEEKDIAYQLQSNYIKIMVDTMDNYDYGDYVQYPLSYFASKLDEYNNNDNYATTILELMSVQYDDFHDDSMEVAQESFYPLYEYIAKMYLDKNIKDGMSYNDAVEVMDTLVSDITYDVSEDYHIDKKYFYSYLDKYYDEFIENSKYSGIDDVKSR